jgi:hypothetical protein
VDAADFDGDGAMEYVAGSGGVMVFNSAGEKVWSSADIKYTTNVIAADLDGDGFTEVVSGSGDSTVRMFSSKPYLASTQAARFFKDAVVLYDAGDLSSALEKAKKSKLLFEALASVDGVDNATKLITKIEKRSQADELLKKSQDNYDARALSEALDYANQSKAAYESIGMDSGAKAAEEVISKVNTLPKAQSNLAEARRLYALGDYITAGEEAAKAAELFEWLADENGTKEARELANKTAPYVEAEARLDSARQHLSDGLYSEALTEIAAAKVTYESLDYDEGVSSAASLEREVRFARLKKNKIFWIEMVLIVPMTMLAAILLTAVYIVRKKQGKTLLGAQHGLGRESQLIRSKTNMGKTGRKRL